MLRTSRPLRAAILWSHGCPGVAELLADPARGRTWDLVCAVSSEEQPAQGDLALFRSADIRVVCLPIRPFYRLHGRALSDLSLRRNYDEQVAARLFPFHPDLLLLSSYIYVATPVLLGATRNGVVNIHGSDLTRKGSDGRPQYLGLRAVADAIFAGEPETRATAHWVTEEVDMGPPILRSRAFPVSPLVPAALARDDRKAVKAYAYAHQEWMLHEAWGSLWKQVIRRVAAGHAVPERARWPAQGTDARSDLDDRVRPIAAAEPGA